MEVFERGFSTRQRTESGCHGVPIFTAQLFVWQTSSEVATFVVFKAVQFVENHRVPRCPSGFLFFTLYSWFHR